MNIIWNLQHDNNCEQVKLVYNIYIRSKTLYVNDKKILSSIKLNSDNEFSFTLNSMEYKIHLTPEDYGYTGWLITPEGKKIYPETKNRVYYKTPLWIIPFVIINMFIPVISVEALTPWVIGILSSYVCANFAKKPKLNIKTKVLISSVISILAWCSYYIFYLSVKRYGMNGGFLPFK